MAFNVPRKCKQTIYKIFLNASNQLGRLSLLIVLLRRFLISLMRWVIARKVIETIPRPDITQIKNRFIEVQMQRSDQWAASCNLMTIKVLCLQL